MCWRQQAIFADNLLLLQRLESVRSVVPSAQQAVESHSRHRALAAGQHLSLYMCVLYVFISKKRLYEVLYNMMPFSSKVALRKHSG